MKGIGFKLTALMLSIILIGIIITFGVAVVFSGNVTTRESLEGVSKSTAYETERLDNWLTGQMSSMDTLAGVIASMDELAAVLLSDQVFYGIRLEDQTAEMLRPVLKSVLDGYEAFFDVYMGFLDGSAVAASGYQFDYSWWAAPERGWFKLALTDITRTHVTSPYVDAQTGELCITVARAVYYNGSLIGVIGADVMVTELQNITLQATLDSNGYSMLIDGNGDILVHPDSEYAPNEKGEFNNLATIKDGAYADMWRTVSASDGVYMYKADGKNQYYTASQLDTSGWYLVAAIPTSVITQPIAEVIVIVVLITVAILLIAACVIFLIIKRSVSQPLAPVTAFFNKIGLTGDFSFRQAELDALAAFSQRKDEFGTLTNAAVEFVRHVTGINRTLEMIADGDLTPEIDLISENDTMGKSLRLVLNKLNSMFREINDSSYHVSIDARRVADSAQFLAQGATEQTATIHDLSSSIRAISDKTNENARIAREASALSDVIKENAERGNVQMEQMMLAVREINEASDQINKVIKVIDDIAFRTNILALNAAVEAAHAGQHGKGFAVVADEVRNLASKSAEAARDTGSMIEDSINKANYGLSIATETSASLGKIVEGIKQSAEIVKRIADSSDAQADAINQVNIGIDQVAQVVHQNSAASEESAATSHEMSSQSDMLQRLLAQFRLKDGGAPGRSVFPETVNADARRLKPSGTNPDNPAGGEYGKY